MPGPLEGTLFNSFIFMYKETEVPGNGEFLTQVKFAMSKPRNIPDFLVRLAVPYCQWDV